MAEPERRADGIEILRRGARAVGIEYDPALAALAKRNAQRAGVADRVSIIAGDIFKEDFSAATVVTLLIQLGAGCGSNSVFK